MTQAIPAKPVPIPDELTAPFFAGGERGALVLQRCDVCASWVALGSRVCTECLSEKLTWADTCGRAKLHTFAVMHQQYHPAFAGEIPYNVAVVELDEGPRLYTNIIGCENAQLRVGMRLEATFEKASDDLYLPKFRPVSS